MAQDQQPTLILATTSAREKKAFEQLRIPFEAVESEVDETTYRTDDPDVLVAELSKRKARAVAEKHRKKTVIATHTVGHHRRDILE
ncbi:Maf family protein, partial [Candidatus Woesearchaeota archaeon]|nr:Maf family protein [Candidatus Woesearchaeota archaeon]